MLSSISEPSRALAVIPSDTVNIPYPNVALRSTTTDTDQGKLIDADVNFIESGIKVGDTVFNETAGTWCIVTGIRDENTLYVSEDIFTGSLERFNIYQGVNQGCLLYVANGSYLTVLTAGNDVVSFNKIAIGVVLPVRVLRVFATGTDCSDIVAVW